MVRAVRDAGERDAWFWSSRRCGVFKVEPHAWPASERIKAIPMQSMKVAAGVKNGVVFGEATQTYTNKDSCPLELKFLFDAENCSVGDVSMEIEGKVTRGIVKGAAEAQDIYDDAIAQGQQASLMQKKSTPKGDFFELVLGNLSPGLEAKITFKFMAELRHTLKLWGEGREAVLSLPITTAVIDPSGAGLDLELRVDLGSGPIDPSTVRCPSGHKMEAKEKDGALVVCLEPKQAASVCDTLRVAFPMPEGYRATSGWATLSSLPTGVDAAQAWGASPFDRRPLPPPQAEEGSTGASGEGGAGGAGAEHAVSVVFAPEICKGGRIEVATDAMMQREMVFVIDRSGSMSGGLIKRAKAALELLLHSMTPGCKFNVVSFGTSYQMMYKTSQPYSKVKDAVEKVGGMSADMGGTQLLGLFSSVLSSKPLRGYPRQVFLLTDGGVSDTQRVLDVVDSQCKDTRIFAVGLGSSASSELLTGMSKRGNGEVIHLDGEDEMAGPLMDQMFRASAPAITDVEIDWGDLAVLQIDQPGMNRGARTTYLGEVITASALLESLPEGPSQVTLRAKIGDGLDFAHSIVVDPASREEGGDVACHLSAAKREITALERATEGADSAVGTEWSVRWGMVSKFASCVAVDEQMRGAVAGAMEGVLVSGGECDEITSCSAASSNFMAIQSEVDRVSQVMACNIEKVLDRGEKIEHITSKSDTFEMASNEFRLQARSLKRKQSPLGGIASALSNAGSAFMGLLSKGSPEPSSQSAGPTASYQGRSSEGNRYLADDTSDGLSLSHAPAPPAARASPHPVTFVGKKRGPGPSGAGASHRGQGSDDILSCASKQQTDGSWEYDAELFNSLGLPKEHLAIAAWASGLGRGEVAAGVLTAIILAHLAGLAGRESETKLVRFKARRFLLQWIQSAPALGEVAVPPEHRVPVDAGTDAGDDEGMTDEGGLSAALRALQGPSA